MMINLYKFLFSPKSPFPLFNRKNSTSINPSKISELAGHRRLAPIKEQVERAELVQVIAIVSSPLPCLTITLSSSRLQKSYVSPLKALFFK